MSDNKFVRNRKKAGDTKKSNNATEAKETTTDKKSDETEKIKEPKYGPMPHLPNHRLWTRGIMVAGVMIVIYFSSYKGREVTLAKQSEPTQFRGQHIKCSEDYKAEVETFPGCVPEQCGRVISDGLVSQREARELLEIAKRGMSLGGGSGGATILDLHSGALSLGAKFINLYSLPNIGEKLTNQDFTLYKIIRKKIHHAVAHHFRIDSSILHLTHPTFFSKLSDKEPETPNDQYWHPHVDKDTYEAFHYTSLLYLNDYDIDFKGGRFVFIDADATNRTVEPRKGRVSMFTSGSENKHFVERVTSGVRYALTVSFTCDKKSAIQDPSPKLPK